MTVSNSKELCINKIISHDSVCASANDVQVNKFRLLILNGMIVHVHLETACQKRCTRSHPHAMQDVNNLFPFSKSGITDKIFFKSQRKIHPHRLKF